MVASRPKLKAPFPAFGGKSRTARIVWDRFGDVRNYVEPFCFSAATLLLRPAPKPDEPHRIETLNDANAYVANFWRAVAADPEGVAREMDWPVNEADLHARHAWLVTSREARANLTKVRESPTFYDVRIAGWWCWGACMWIGSGWCDEPGTREPATQRPILDPGARGGVQMSGVTRDEKQLARHARLTQQVPINGSGKGVNAPGHKRPSTGKIHGGVGMLVPADTHRPQIADAYSRGRGVHGNDSAEERAARRAWLVAWCNALADRLRPVRVCCGDWSRVCDSPSVLTRLGVTGVFLDPPYALDVARMLRWYAHLADPKVNPAPDPLGKIRGVKSETGNRVAGIYANDRAQDVDRMVAEVAAWCVKWGGAPDLRVAVCGLEGEYPMLDALGWEKIEWKSIGYGARGKSGNLNATRERIWFNKNCISPEANKTLWDLVTEAPATGDAQQCRSTKRSSSGTSRATRKPSNSRTRTRR